MSQTECTREIGIDAGHRVTNHGSKCRNVHGHRYTIQVTLGGDLETSGEQEGMVLDFSFLKELMMHHIDEPCDHGLILWVNDPLLGDWFGPSELQDAALETSQWGYAQREVAFIGKVYITDSVPTAENLAAHWHRRLAEPVDMRTQGRARITRVRVWETPNCYADFIP